MTPNTKEALERLKTDADRLSGGDPWQERHAADLSWLIAEQEGLEREVARLTDENEKLRGMPDDDRKSCIALMELLSVARAERDTYRKTMETMVEAPDVVASLCARVTSAEARTTALDHAATTLPKRLEHGLALLATQANPMSMGEWNDFSNAVLAVCQQLRALLHPAVPVETDPGEYPPPCANPGGHVWVCRDDDEEVSYCEHCGADGNA